MARPSCSSDRLGLLTNCNAKVGKGTLLLRSAPGGGGCSIGQPPRFCYGSAGGVLEEFEISFWVWARARLSPSPKGNDFHGNFKFLREFPGRTKKES